MIFNLSGDFPPISPSKYRFFEIIDQTTNKLFSMAFCETIIKLPTNNKKLTIVACDIEMNHSGK